MTKTDPLKESYTITFDETNTDYASSYYPNPTYTFDNLANNTINWTGPGATVGGVTESVFVSPYGQGFYVDEALVESNPTCKSIWEQFKYVYEIVKRDKENEDSGDEVNF